MIYTKEQNKELCERYPFLIPRSVWTGEIDPDFEYDYIEGIGEIPVGWEKLFLQMCEDIRQPLIDANYLDEFRFSQIKEKYGSLRCYHFGAPAPVDRIIDDYEHISGMICTKCGNPATVKTVEYILPFCNNCKPDRYKAHPIDFSLERRILKFDGEKTVSESYDCSYIWKKMFEV